MSKKKITRARIRSDPKNNAPDDTALVDTTVEFDNDLTRSVVINELEFVDVTCFCIEKSPSVVWFTICILSKRRDLQPQRHPRARALTARVLNVPCFCITCKNLITTLETGRTST
jgi:hypothetical protein